MLDIDDVVDGGETVVGFGALRITTPDGTEYDVQVAHRWELSGGAVVRMRAYPDSAVLNEALAG